MCFLLLAVEQLPCWSVCVFLFLCTRPPPPPVGTVFIAKGSCQNDVAVPGAVEARLASSPWQLPAQQPRRAAQRRQVKDGTCAASGVKRNGFTLDVVTFDLSDSGVRSVAEPRLLWERVERLVPRSSHHHNNNSGGGGSGGSSSSSSSSNSSSQPGSHCGSGERFRARCESRRSGFRPGADGGKLGLLFHTRAFSFQPPPNRRARPSSGQRMLGKNQMRGGTWSGRADQR